MSAEGQTTGNVNLQKQDLAQLDISKLTPLSPEVISRQATINIGTIGHVAHGKSTVVKAISGVHTVRFKNELERNITIKLERISDERISDLTLSPILLREYSNELEEKQTQHRLQVVVRRLQSISRKRTSSEANFSPIDANAKRTKMMEFLDMKDNGGDNSQASQSSFDKSTEDDALSDNSHATGMSSALSAGEQNWSDTDIDASSIVANLNLLRDLKQLSEFRKLPKSYVDLIKPRTSPSQAHIKKPIAVLPHEFTVEKILNIERKGSIPYFGIKWKGYSSNHNTLEPLHHIVDCQEYNDFAAEKLAEEQSKIEDVLKDCIDKVNEIKPLSDADGLSFVSQFDVNLFEADLIVLADIYKGRKTKVLEKIIARTVTHIRLLPFYTRRVLQQHQMVEWAAQINATDQSSRLTVENDVDFEVPPMDFTYINDVLPRDGIIIPDEPPIGCDCEPKCSQHTTCCGKLSGSKRAYDRKRILRVPQGTPIFECNKRCKCGPDCNNRVVQQGRQHSLRIFKTSNGCGWGVRTDQRIEKGQFICEYVGEVISYEEAEKRGKIYDAEGRTYLFDLDFNSNDNPYSIDAAKFGNVSHFINHSCDPNLGVWAVWINCLDLDLPKICLFALRQIEAGEEITFDYKNQYGRDNSILNSSQEESFGDGQMGETKNEDDQTDEPSNRVDGTPCRCGAANCRKFLF